MSSSSSSFHASPILHLCLLLTCLQGSTSRHVPVQVEEKHRELAADEVGLGHVHDHDQSPTWQSFERFLDAERGTHVSGMAELKTYFHRFGYLPGINNGSSALPANFTDAFDERFESAVALYQSKLGLNITGKLDSDTISLLMAPRCGVSDERVSVRPHGTGSGIHAVKHFSFFPGQPRWDRSRPMTLSYAFSPTNFIDYLNASDIQAALRRAFARWAAVIPVTFVESTDYSTADIRIGFYGGDHGDGEPFDGVLGVLAHAFSPETGRLHLDSAETWAVDFKKERSSTAVDLESVATHEIGHVLGLAHSGVRGSIMYPSLNPRTKKVALRADDVHGVQALYGSNPNFKFSSLMESDMSSSSSSLFYDGRRRWWRCIGVLVMVIWFFV